jgi:hypothetical protein
MALTGTSFMAYEPGDEPLPVEQDDSVDITESCVIELRDDEDTSEDEDTDDDVDTED